MNVYVFATAGILTGGAVAVGASYLSGWIRAPAPRIADANSSSARRTIDLTGDEIVAGFRGRHAKRLAAHAAQERDATWAPLAAAALELDLSALSAEKFWVIDVDCRQRSCVATLGWTSYKDARQITASLLHYPYLLSCGVEIALDPPTDSSSETYASTVLFDPCHRE